MDPANQKVPGLRPWRPGPTLSPGLTRLTSENRLHVPEMKAKTCEEKSAITGVFMNKLANYVPLFKTNFAIFFAFKY